MGIIRKGSYISRLLGSILVAPVMLVVTLIISAIILIIGFLFSAVLPITGLLGKNRFFVKEGNTTHFVRIGGNGLKDIISNRKRNSK